MYIFMIRPSKTDVKKRFLNAIAVIFKKPHHDAFVFELSMPLQAESCFTQ